MYLIEDKRNGKRYKTKYPIHDDKLCNLYALPFIKNGVLTEQEANTQMKCKEKWPFFDVIAVIDGRLRIFKNLDWFTWRLVFENNNN